MVFPAWLSLPAKSFFPSRNAIGGFTIDSSFLAPRNGTQVWKAVAFERSATKAFAAAALRRRATTASVGTRPGAESVGQHPRDDDGTPG